MWLRCAMIISTLLVCFMWLRCAAIVNSTHFGKGLWLQCAVIVSTDVFYRRFYMWLGCAMTFFSFSFLTHAVTCDCDVLSLLWYTLLPVTAVCCDCNCTRCYLWALCAAIIFTHIVNLWLTVLCCVSIHIVIHDVSVPGLHLHTLLPVSTMCCDCCCCCFLHTLLPMTVWVRCAAIVLHTLLSVSVMCSDFLRNCLPVTHTKRALLPVTVWVRCAAIVLTQVVACKGNRLCSVLLTLLPVTMCRVAMYCDCFSTRCYLWAPCAVFQMEGIIERMQDECTGVPVRTVKSFMSKVPSVFTGQSPTVISSVFISLALSIPLLPLFLLPLFFSPRILPYLLSFFFFFRRKRITCIKLFCMSRNSVFHLFSVSFSLVSRLRRHLSLFKH